MGDDGVSTMRLATSQDIGLAIRAERHLRGLSQAELAARLGASRRWVIDIENGNPTAEIGRVLAAFSLLGIALQSSVPGADPRPETSPTTEAGIDIDRHLASFRRRK
ncbi:MAG: helix-turn-helix domain-containing protein [Janthinobacterium lividum]